MFDTPLIFGNTPATSAHTSQRHPLGALLEWQDDTYGAQVYRYIWNNSGSDIAANLLVMAENGTDLYQGIVCGAAAPTVRVLGCTVAAIANGSYGWVLCSGRGLFTSDGSTTANTAQKTAASGLLTDGVTGTDEMPVWAHATESPAGSGGTFIGTIRCM